MVNPAGSLVFNTKEASSARRSPAAKWVTPFCFGMPALAKEERWKGKKTKRPKDKAPTVQAVDGIGGEGIAGWIGRRGGRGAQRKASKEHCSIDLEFLSLSLTSNDNINVRESLGHGSTWDCSNAAAFHLGERTGL